MADDPTSDPACDPLQRWQQRVAAFLHGERHLEALTAATVRHHDLYLRTYTRWWFDQLPDRDPCTATRDDIEAFLLAEAARGMAAVTRRSQLSALRKLYAWLVSHDLAEHNPARRVITPRVGQAEIVVYQPEEIAAIFTHLRSLDDLRGRLRHVIVACLRYTGMRSVELRTLTLDRLELAHGRAQVHGKGGRRRTVLLPPKLAELLEVYLADIRPQLPDSPLLLSNPARLVTTPDTGFGPEAIHREVRLAGQHAGLPGRHHPHRWRHTYATELVRAGVELYKVQRLLGHKSVSTTMVYTHLVVDDLAAAAALLE